MSAIEARKIGGKPASAPTRSKRSTHCTQGLKMSSLTASARSMYLSLEMSSFGGVHLADLSVSESPQLRSQKSVSIQFNIDSLSLRKRT